MDRQKLLQILSDNFNACTRERRPYYGAVATLSFLSNFDDIFGAAYIKIRRARCMAIIAEQVAKHPDLVTFRRALTYPDPRDNPAPRHYFYDTDLEEITERDASIRAALDPALPGAEVTVIHRSQGGTITLRPGATGNPDL